MLEKAIMSPPAAMLALQAAPVQQAAQVKPLGVSVIIVNYNAGEYLASCLLSLVRAGSFTDEIIVVDNASTDGSGELVSHAYPQVHFIRSQTNLGFSGGNNLGAAHAHGRYLAFLNPDTVVEPGWLDALIDALESDPRAGLATAKILMLDDPSRINTCGNEMHFTGLTLCRGAWQDRSHYSQQEEITAVSGAAFVIRRDLYERLGGFDEAFFLYVEDTDLSFRARLAGYRVLYVPTSIVYHQYTLRFGPQKSYYQERNRYLLLLKSLRWRTLIILLPALLLAEVVAWGFILLKQRGQILPKLRAYAALLRELPQVLKKRRQAQQLRAVRDGELLATCAYRLAYEQADQGTAGRLAHRVFDPLFGACHRFALRIIGW